MAHDLAPIRQPIDPEKWRRLPDNLRGKRGSDQSDVSERCFVDFRLRLSPRLERKVATAARKRGCSQTAVVRDLIEKGLP